MKVKLDPGAYLPERAHDADAGNKHPPHNFIDMTGKRFGKLYVAKRVEDKTYSNGVKKPQWLCICDCGNVKKIVGESLRSGCIVSCGCYGKSILGLSTTRHGKRHCRIYSIYCDIKKRCYNQNAINYKHYGQKGIKMCNEWLNDFTAFYEWSMSHGYTDELTIDRINSSGNYEPSNCEWVTRSENTRRRNAEYWRKYHESKIG